MQKFKGNFQKRLEIHKFEDQKKEKIEKKPLKELPLQAVVDIDLINWPGVPGENSGNKEEEEEIFYSELEKNPRFTEFMALIPNFFLIGNYQLEKNSLFFFLKSIPKNTGAYTEWIMNYLSLLLFNQARGLDNHEIHAFYASIYQKIQEKKFDHYIDYLKKKKNLKTLKTFYHPELKKFIEELKSR